VVWYNIRMNNPTNYRSDLNSEEQIIMQDAIEDMMMDGNDRHPGGEYEPERDDCPEWNDNEDGSGQWSDGWDRS
jgi:hypothetical protein